jgi:hypothetical protein
MVRGISSPLQGNSDSGELENLEATLATAARHHKRTEWFRQQARYHVIFRALIDVCPADKARITQLQQVIFLRSSKRLEFSASHNLSLFNPFHTQQMSAYQLSFALKSTHSVRQIQELAMGAPASIKGPSTLYGTHQVCCKR